MKKLTTIIGLAALLALAGCSVKIRGQWNPDNPSQFQASTPLVPGESYRIRNNTEETITVWLLDDRTPIDYFLVLPWDYQDFTSPGDAFDLHTGAQTIRGVSLWWIPNW